MPTLWMGGVGGGFGRQANLPGCGSPSFNQSRSRKDYRWGEHNGRYGVAMLSNSLLFPLDGINFQKETHNKFLGYGYMNLPLTAPQKKQNDEDVDRGNHCWTLFTNTANFKGPVAFFTPNHWAQYSLKNPLIKGRTFDNSLLKLNNGSLPVLW